MKRRKNFTKRRNNLSERRKSSTERRYDFFASRNGENETKDGFLRYKKEKSNKGGIVWFYSENTDS